MAAVTMGTGLFEEAWTDLRAQIEQVGFFLAEFDDVTKTFHVLEWRLVPPEGFEYQGPFHVALRDEVQTSVIQWATTAGACLVEAHSHDDRWHAELSPTDLSGLDEWVPHVRWRLRGRPYGALVVGGDEFDGLAWTDTSATPEQIVSVAAAGLHLEATGRTLEGMQRDAAE